MKVISAGEIAQLVDAAIFGDPETKISGIATIEDVSPGQLTFAFERKYLTAALGSPAAAILTVSTLPEVETGGTKTLICVSNPRLAYAKILELFRPPTTQIVGISPLAEIHPSASLGENVSIGAFCYIGKDVQLEDNVQLYPRVTILDGCRVGKGTVIYPDVTLYGSTSIGESCLVHSGTVIGADGFGFVPTDEGPAKIPQIGTVEIGSECEIGANVTIDRATTGKTRLGDRVKVDDQVHIGHNVQVGDNTIIVAQVGISGSVRIGRNVTIAGQAGIASHVEIGEGAVIGAKSGVTKSVPAKMEVSGFPARPHQDEKKLKVSLLRIPQLLQTYEELVLSLQRLSDRINRIERSSRV